MKKPKDSYQWSRLKRSRYTLKRSAALARLLLALALTKHSTHSRQITYNKLCNFMVEAGGVYTKFLQSVLLGVPEVQQWMKTQAVDFFENVPVEPLDVGKILQDELGERVGRLRLWPDPIASGTFAQVYEGLLDLQLPIVVKLQRQTIRPSLKNDVWLLRKFVRYGRPFLTSVDTDIGAISKDFARITLAEMDYKREAAMGELLRERTASVHPELIIPKTYIDMSTDHLLVQERLGGVSVATLLKNQQTVPLTTAQRQAMQHMMTSVLLLPFTTGMVHADPHPGNVRLMDDGRIALLDFGAVDDTPVELLTYQRLLEALIKAMEGTITGAEALEAYFAAFAPRLYRALEVTGQALGLPPVFQTFAKFTLGGQANQPQLSYKGSIFALANINKVVNPRNRFMLRTSLQNVSYSRATHTVVQTMELLGLRDEMNAALKPLAEQARSYISDDHTTPLSTAEAKAIVYAWLEKVVERNPLMVGELRKAFGMLKQERAQHNHSSQPS